MTRRVRLIVFGAGLAVLAALLLVAIHNLPPWGDYRGPYGNVVAGLAVYQRHATDVVNAITYDYRGIDTLGEEFILFAAVVGILLLLREAGAAPPQPYHDYAPLSETVRTFAGPAVVGTLLFGIYLMTHGQLTPGGGFQGGVVAAGAPLLVYLAQDADAFHRLASHPLMESAEALGASAYAAIGLIAFLFGAPFLTDVLPLGKTGNVFSSGTIAWISFSVGVEVAAAFVLTIQVYLREMMDAPTD